MLNRSDNKNNNNKLPLFNAYAFMLLYGNATLAVGYPAERLKVAAQLNLSNSTWASVKPILFSNFSNLYTGFISSVIRQNLKYTYRTPIISYLPHKVDQYIDDRSVGAVLKASFASLIDTFFATPFETIKTHQMKSMQIESSQSMDNSNQVPKHLSIRDASKLIYKQGGGLGFFAGAKVSAIKSFPTWFYLFAGYEATDNKRQKGDFLSTMIWASIVAAPLTLFTTPLDVIKTQQQGAELIKKNESLLKSTQTLYKNFGIISLFKGISFRLLHRSMATATGYMLMDLSRKIQ